MPTWRHESDSGGWFAMVLACLQHGILMKTCPAGSPSPGPSSSWLYLLERFDVGVVHLDLELRVMGMNDYARRSLPVADKMPFGKLVTSFHPEAARAKVKFLLGQAECPVNNAPPMAMIRVSKICSQCSPERLPVGSGLAAHG